MGGHINCSHVGYQTMVITTITHADGRKGMTHALIKKMTLMSAAYQQEGSLSTHASLWAVEVPQRHFL